MTEIWQRLDPFQLVIAAPQFCTYRWQVPQSIQWLGATRMTSWTTRTTSVGFEGGGGPFPPALYDAQLAAAQQEAAGLDWVIGVFDMESDQTADGFRTRHAAFITLFRSQAVRIDLCEIEPDPPEPPPFFTNAADEAWEIAVRAGHYARHQLERYPRELVSMAGELIYLGKEPRPN